VSKEKLSQEYLERTAQNILSLEYFNQIVKDLDPSVKVILLKGEALLNSVYEDEGSRRLAEVDVLIRREDFSDFKNYLSSCGYRFTENIVPSSDVGYINSVMCKKDVKFWPAIHLHWHPVNNSFPAYMFAPRIDIGQIWKAAQPLDGYDNVLKMAPHHQLIYLSEHSLKHSFERPIHLRDIYMLIRRNKDSLDWDGVVTDAKKFNLGRAVYYALYFNSKILEADIPEYVLEELRPKKITFLEQRFIRSVLNHRQKSDSSYVVYLAMNEGLSNKIRFIYRTFFPPREAMGHLKDVSISKVNFIHYLSRVTRSVRTIRRLASTLLAG